MSSCHENTKQLVTMQGQMNSLQITMQSIADQMHLITNHINPKQTIAESASTSRSPVKKKQRHTGGQ